MENRPVLNIQTLGKLRISCGETVFPLERQRSAQVELLIVYLILNRNMNLTSSQLIDFLWPDGDSDKPEGALRNLVYRARKEMKKFFDDINCIQSQGRGYYWNLDIECKIDYEEIMKMASRVEQESDWLRKYEKCLTLLSLYQNNFLPEFNYNDWIMQMNNALEVTCLDTILHTFDVLVQHQKYNEILKITNHPHIQNLLDSRLYEMKLYAYYKSEQYDTALSFYRQTVDLYYSRYGMPVSQKFKGIYQLILDTIPTAQVDVDELEENLNHNGNVDTTFYCDFEVFKNIYQVNLRSARRSMKARVLALLTLEDETSTLSEKQIQEEAGILRNVIASSLRKNDVFSKFNMTQFSLIIASPDLDGARIAVNRIQKRYDEKKKHDEMILKSDLKKIN
ncbi:AfsR/SARP family transcriptional regulator [Candidatus Stoquefichus sp. SB1]|uniref:AfsR/SARP family transcriptional regulator n=1 Tax=Candidatus Stoquefichus sp. SB1 TaxID=1658109 RepID=UPI00067E89B1|nr:helix-turn-helix domain-containing protein [Candidatus Stoquefichus sp. SB1]